MSTPKEIAEQIWNKLNVAGHISHFYHERHVKVLEAELTRGQKTEAQLREQLAEAQKVIEYRKMDCRSLSDALRRTEAERDKLADALDVIPIMLMQVAGPPYTVTFSKDAFKLLERAALAELEKK